MKPFHFWQKFHSVPQTVAGIAQLMRKLHRLDTVDAIN